MDVEDHTITGLGTETEVDTESDTDSDILTSERRLLNADELTKVNQLGKSLRTLDRKSFACTGRLAIKVEIEKMQLFVSATDKEGKATNT